MLDALKECLNMPKNKDLAEYLGITSQAVSNWYSRNTFDTELIYTKCDFLNPEWLLTGKGEMLKTEKPPTHIKKQREEEETRPRIPMDATAGSLSIAVDNVTMEQCEQMPVIKAFSRYDFTIFARGDSMEPEYHSGDELACLYIKNTSFVQWGRTHVLDTAQGIIVKRIFDNEEAILCKSDNELYPDFNIHKSELYNIALVIGVLRRY